MKLTILILCFLFPPLENDSSSKQEGVSYEYRTYTNSSRRYTVKYPAHFYMGSASDSDDGRTFTGYNGLATINVYSSYYDLDLDTRYYDDVYDDESIVTYKVRKSNWYVVSGYSKVTNNEFYKKVYRSARYGDYKVLYFEYPHSLSSVFDIFIPVMIKSFKDI